MQIVETESLSLSHRFFFPLFATIWLPNLVLEQGEKVNKTVVEKEKKELILVLFFFSILAEI